MRACREGGIVLIALMAAAAAEVQGQPLRTGGDILNALILESKKPAWTGIILANGRVNFNTSADGPDIYQSRSNPSQTSRAPKSTRQSHSPLPARRSESAQNLQTQAELSSDQADALKRQGRYAEAEEFYLREFAIAEKRIAAGGFTNYSFAFGLGDIYEQQHRITELEALHKRLLAAVEKAPGPEEKSLYFVTQLASFYFQHKRYSEADQYYKQALALAENYPGREQDDLLRVLEYLAKIYMETGRDAEAEPLLKRELTIAEAIHKPESDEVLRHLLRLATFYANLDRADEAIPLFERLIVAAQKEAREKGDSFRLGETFRQLGEFYERQGRLAEAEALYKRLHAFGEEMLLAQKNASVHNVAVTELYVFYRDHNRPAEQEAVLQRSLELHEKIFGEDGPQLLGPLKNLALFQGEQGHHAEAEKFYRRVIAIREGKAEDILPMLALALKAQGRHGEAEELYKRVLAIRENEIGPEDFRVSSYGNALHDLVKLYQGLGRTAEIERLYKRAAALIDEKVLRPANQKKADLLLAVAQLYHDHGRYAEAASAAEQRLALIEAEGQEEAIRKALDIVGSLHLLQERLADAEPVVKRALSLAEKLHGADHVETAMAVQNLARVNRRQMRYREAETLFLRALAIVEAERARIVSLSRNSSRRYDEYLYIRKLSTILNNLGLLYEDTGEYNKAEQKLRRNLEIVYTPTFTPDYDQFAIALTQLGGLYLELGRLSEAEPLLKQALEVNEEIQGRAHPNTAIALHDLGLLRLRQRRYREGEDLLRQALGISERALGPEHITVAGDLTLLGQVLDEQGRHTDAEPLLKRALAISEKALGPEHPDVAAKLKALADLYVRQNRNAEAGAAIRRVLAIVKKTLGDRHDWTAISLGEWASVNERLGDWSEAHRLRREATGLLIGRPHQHEADRNARFGAGNTEQYSRLYLDHAHTAMRLARQDSNRTQALVEEAFEIVQQAKQSEAAAALAQTVARLSTGKDELARLARQRQDLVERLKLVDKALVTLDLEKLVSDTKSDQRRALRKEQEDIERQIAETDALLRERFPEYAALVNPKPLSVSEVQHWLRPDEAVYQVAVAKDKIFGWSEVYVWVVTSEAMRGTILSIDEPALADAVYALRCGLDLSVWKNSRGTEAGREDERGIDRVEADLPGPERCRRLLGARPAGQVLPFDLSRAHELYKALFAPFEDLIRDKHLLVVPTESLGTLPFQVLVTHAPSPDTDYAHAAWLGLRQPITMLPSVPSLKALRTVSRQRAANPYLGFGNPLLAGLSGDDRRAWDKQSCAPSQSLWTRLAGPLDRSPSEDEAPQPIPRGGLQDFYRNGLGDVARIRLQPPLPETADELCSVARALGASDSSVFLGARASEARLKELSAKGQLGASRVLHFATHGLVAAETEVLARSRLEPALLMTPPDEPSETDDGLLTASEVAQLKLNADFVILSACNTAAGDGKADGEALSGLARAFLYAGSRSLLVSHWYVNSRAAVDLVTGIFGELEANPTLGRAEALRRAMAAQVSQGRFHAHPSYWAPFVIVGEGGA